MTEPTTVNTGLIVPNTGDLPGTWGANAINPDLSAIDGFIGGVQVVSVTNSPITLTSPASFTPTPSAGPTQSQNAVLRVTGTLTGNVQITLPLPGYMIVENLTTGAFVVTLRAVGSGEVIGIEQSSIVHVYNDGSNVRFVNLSPVGSYMDLCDASVPLWISSCTKPPYLMCDGSTFSNTTYPYLYAKLGTTTLPDARGRARYMLNQGTNRILTSSTSFDGNTRFSGGGSTTIFQQNLPNVSFNVSGITLNNGGVSVFVNNSVSPVAGSSGIWGVAGNPLIQLGTVSVFSSVTVATQGAAASGGSAQVIAPPGYVGGITMIRAA